jgi:hypothetical protein
MANCVRELTYKCSDDCVISGCPGHAGKLEWQSVSDAYTFTMNGRTLNFERGELDAMLSLLGSLNRIAGATPPAGAGEAVLVRGSWLHESDVLTLQQIIASTYTLTNERLPADVRDYLRNLAGRIPNVPTAAPTPLPENGVELIARTISAHVRGSAVAWDEDRRTAEAVAQALAAAPADGPKGGREAFVNALVDISEDGIGEEGDVREFTAEGHKRCVERAYAALAATSARGELGNAVLNKEK